VSRPAQTLALALRNDASALDAAREEIRRHLERHGVDDTAVYAVDLVLEELAGNTIRYGYAKGAQGAIQIELAVGARNVRLTIQDDARPFDPTCHPEPKPARSVRESPVGGRGIAMVRRYARAMRYRRERGANSIEVEVARG